MSAFTVTVMVPVVAPVGTVVVMLVAVDAVTVAATPLKFTVLLAGVVLKFVPVMVTVVPTGPLAGAKLAIVGGMKTVNEEALVAVSAFTVTVIVPVVAPTVTVVVMLVAVDAFTVAPVPLKLTVLSAGVVLKPVPVMVTVVPTGPLMGLKELIAGTNSTSGLAHKLPKVLPAKSFVPLTLRAVIPIIPVKPALALAHVVPLFVDTNTPLGAPANMAVPFKARE